MVFLGFPTAPLSCSDAFLWFPDAFQKVSGAFHMIFSGLSFKLPEAYLWFPLDLAIAPLGFSDVFPWFSHGFRPMGIPWENHGKLERDTHGKTMVRPWEKPWDSHGFHYMAKLETSI